jgi:cyclopropane-fatty-acyl-phospholipid synthase
MDLRRDEVRHALEQAYGAEHASQWWMRWRLFFMSCAELFRYDGGRQWWVAHYLFGARP